MSLVIAGNPTYLDAERTYLTDPVVAGATSLNVQNSTFANNSYLVVGNPGQEKTEIVQLTAIPSLTTLTITATGFTHNPDDPIYYSRFNQVRIYHATVLTGTYSLLTTVAIDIDNPSLQTVYDDTTGLSTDYYKISYYNNVSTLESSLSDPIPALGYGRTTVSYIIDGVLQEVIDTNEQLTTRGEVMRWLNDCNDDVHSRRRKWNHWKTSATLTATASQRAVSLLTLTKPLDKFDDLLYHYTVLTPTDETYRLRYIPQLEFDNLVMNNTDLPSDQLQKFTWDEATFSLLLYPKPKTTQTNVLTLKYWQMPTIITSEGQTVEIPDTRIYHHYCAWQFYIKKDDLARAREYEKKYERSIITLTRQQRREQGQPRSMMYHAADIREFYKY